MEGFFSKLVEDRQRQSKQFQKLSNSIEGLSNKVSKLSQNDKGQQGKINETNQKLDKLIGLTEDGNRTRRAQEAKQSRIEALRDADKQFDFGKSNDRMIALLEQIAECACKKNDCCGSGGGGGGGGGGGRRLPVPIPLPFGNFNRNNQSSQTPVPPKNIPKPTDDKQGAGNNIRPTQRPVQQPATAPAAQQSSPGLPKPTKEDLEWYQDITEQQRQSPGFSFDPPSTWLEQSPGLQNLPLILSIASMFFTGGASAPAVPGLAGASTTFQGGQAANNIVQFMRSVKAVARRSGGPITVPGTGSGDKVFSMLPAGSFVLNRNASKFLQSGGMVNVPTMLEPGELVFNPGTWSKGIESLNNFIPRFQQGGVIEHLHGDPQRGGFDEGGHGLVSNAHDHFAFSSPELRQQVQERLANGETQSGRKYQIGSVLRPHDHGSHHSTGSAFDIPWSQFGSGEIGQRDYEQSRVLAKDVQAILRDLNMNASLPSGSSVNSGEEPKNNQLIAGSGSMGMGMILPQMGGSDPVTNILAAAAAPVMGNIFSPLLGTLQSTVGKLTGPLSAAVSGLTSLLGINGSDDTSEPASGAVTNSTWKPLLDLISSVEAKGGSYESMYPSTTLPGATQMTVAQVAEQATGAVGRYQQLPQYLNERARAIGADPNTQLYDAAFQDRLAIEYNILQKQGGRKWLNGEISTNTFINRLSGEWAALPRADGSFTYPGQSSAMGPEQVRGILEGIKRSGNTNVAQGLQTGGIAGVPTMLEPGETVFSPGSFGQDIMALNQHVPRFANGGTVKNISSNVNNYIKDIEDIMDRSRKTEKVQQQVMMSSPRQQSMSMPPAPSPETPKDAPVPILPDNPGNAFQHSLVMTRNLLSANIGG